MLYFNILKLRRKLLKYFLFFRFFLIIKRSFYQYFKISGRWLIILISKNKEIESIYFKIKTQNFGGLIKNQIDFKFKNVLFFEIKFRNQQKIFNSKRELNNFAIMSNKVLLINNKKWTFFGYTIKDCDSSFNIYSAPNVNDTIILTAHGFGKRVFRREYLLTEKYSIIEKKVILNYFNKKTNIFEIKNLLKFIITISNSSIRKFIRLKNINIDNSKHLHSINLKNIPFLKINNSIYNISKFNKNEYL